jgi:hypothetical protein
MTQRAKKSKPTSPFEGRWRITLMEMWDQVYVDEEEEGYFEFTNQDWGEFHFCCVHGEMDCHLTTRDGVPALEWSWDGNDEMDAALGRGWAVLKGDELHGEIFFHGGDSSEFVAKRVRKKATKRK